MATATGVIDTAALVRSATWGGDIVRKAIVAHLDAAANELRAERDGYMESGDAMGDHMHIARVVENVERLRDEIATASLVPPDAPQVEHCRAPAAPQWLDAPTRDGLWWRCEKGSAYVEAVSVRFDHVGGYRVAFVGDLRSEYRHPDASEGLPVYGWLRVDVPEAPR